MLHEIWTYLCDLAAFAAATAVAALPRRYWRRVDLPVERAVLASALATILLAVCIGAPAFMRYSSAQADRATEMMLQATGWRPAPHDRLTASAREQRATAAWWSSYLSFFAFAFFTPVGLLSGYLLLSGAARATAVAADERFGDPILTALDAFGRRLAIGATRRRAARARERLEGPEKPDRLLAGAAAGIPGADCVIVASRRKAGWEPGVFVVTGEKWYRLGTPVERALPGGLRTFYPLTELRDGEVLRRAVRYEMPAATPSTVDS